MPENSPVVITTDRHGKWTLLCVVGDLDMATAPELEKATADADNNLAIDLSGVRFIDSSGLRSLFELNENTDRLVLVSPSAFVQRLLDLTKMTQVFAVVEGLEALSDPA